MKVVLQTELYGRNKILAINGFALPILTYSFGVIHWGARTCSSSIDGPESSSLCTVSTILLQTLTDCTLLAVMGVRGYNRLSRHINLVLWGWTVTLLTVLILLYRWYGSVTPGNLHARSSAWLVALGNYCTAVEDSCSGRQVAELTQECIHLGRRWLRASVWNRCKTLPYVLQFSSCAVPEFSSYAVLEWEAYARAVSPSHWATACGHERDLRMTKGSESSCCNWGTGCCCSRPSSSDSVLWAQDSTSWCHSYLRHMQCRPGNSRPHCGKL